MNRYAVEVRIICSKLHDVIVKWVSLEQNLSMIDWKYCIILERKIGEEKANRFIPNSRLYLIIVRYIYSNSFTFVSS